jgi:diguanylate cyclase (GGDEF)-like protein
MIARPAGDTAPPPDFFRRLSHLVLRLGQRRALVALTLLVLVGAVAVAQLVISALGHGDRVIAAASASLASLLLTPLFGSLLLRLVFELETTRKQLAELVIRDELTGISNRRHFMATLQREWDLARRHASIGTLLLIDADGFKRINDTHGHLCGDAVLREMATVIGGSLRHVDLLARFGGEEFIVFLPHTDSFGALDVAERIRSRVQAAQVSWQGAQISVTVSIGVAPIRRELPTLDWMIHEADTALYAAKAAGRNCVRTLEFARSANDPIGSFKA